MSEFRQDPTTREWVLLAPERASRPDEFAPHEPQPAPEWDPDCPFCPGNEHRRPEEETYRIAGDAGWQVQHLEFNYVIQTAPVGEAHLRYNLWHIQIIPRLTTAAGFELGSGISISSALREQTARLLRSAGRGMAVDAARGRNPARRSDWV